MTEVNGNPILSAEELATLRQRLSAATNLPDWADLPGLLARYRADVAALLVHVEAQQQENAELQALSDAFMEGQAASLQRQERSTNPYPQTEDGGYSIGSRFAQWDDGFDCNINRQLKTALAQADAARLAIEKARDFLQRRSDAQAEWITHLETALREITGFPKEAVTGRELAKYRGDIARRALAASPLRQGCICQCCDHSEGSDCACDCHASGLCSAALVASRSPAPEKP